MEQIEAKLSSQRGGPEILLVVMGADKSEVCRAGQQTENSSILYCDVGQDFCTEKP